MWGNLFGSSTAYQPVVKHDHSAGCRMLKLKEGELVVDLDPINQELLLECTHPSHDSVRKLFMIFCDGDRTNPEEGRLF